MYIPFSLFVCTIFCTRTQNVFCVLCTSRFHPIAHNSYTNKTSLNGMLNMLNESCYVLPFNSKVKINELKVSTNKGYCNKFQIGKCTFGDECRYRHEIDPDYGKKDEVAVEIKIIKIIIKKEIKIKIKIMIENIVKTEINYIHLITIIIVLLILLSVKF